MSDKNLPDQSQISQDDLLESNSSNNSAAASQGAEVLTRNVRKNPGANKKRAASPEDGEPVNELRGMNGIPRHSRDLPDERFANGVFERQLHCQNVSNRKITVKSMNIKQYFYYNLNRKSTLTKFNFVKTTLWHERSVNLVESAN